MRAALSVCRLRCHQVTQQLGAFAAQSSTSLEDQRSHGRTKTLRFLRFSSICSHSWFRRTFVVTFCMRASRADVYPEFLQDTREPSQIAHRCCFVIVLHPVVGLRNMALQVRGAPCLSYEPAQGVLDRTVRFYFCLLRTCSKTGGKGASPEIACTCLHHCPSAKHTYSVGLHPALRPAVTPWPSSIAHSVAVLWAICAWPSGTCQCQVPRTKHNGPLFWRQFTV